MEAEHPEVAFVNYVVKALVDKQEAVEIVRKTDEMGVLLTLTVHPTDMGKVIGKAGAIAKAIRTILRSVGMKNNARVNLKITDPLHQDTVLDPLEPVL